MLRLTKNLERKIFLKQASLLEAIVGKEILADSSYFKEIHILKNHNERWLAELNNGYHPKAEIREYLEKITGEAIDSSVEINLPFYSDFGKHIRFGKNIFININVTFVDLGGITIEDDVLIGPGARLLTVNHLLNPEKRRGLQVASIVVKKNAWIGANATILPGVTIGENAVVAADSTITKDVPDNVVVVGSPAVIAKTIPLPIQKNQGENTR